MHGRAVRRRGRPGLLQACTSPRALAPRVHSPACTRPRVHARRASAVPAGWARQPPRHRCRWCTDAQGHPRARAPAQGRQPVCCVVPREAARAQRFARAHHRRDTLYGGARTSAFWALAWASRAAPTTAIRIARLCIVGVRVRRTCVSCLQAPAVLCACGGCWPGQSRETMGFGDWIFLPLRKSRLAKARQSGAFGEMLTGLFLKKSQCCGPVSGARTTAPTRSPTRNPSSPKR